jgi:hypothetical protein
MMGAKRRAAAQMDAMLAVDDIEDQAPVGRTAQVEP